MPARRLGSASAHLRWARRSVRRLTRTTIPITTHTGTPTRRRPIIRRHPIIRRAAAGTRTTGAITRAEWGLPKGLSSVKWRALRPSIVFAFKADRAGTNEDDRDSTRRLTRRGCVLGAARLGTGCTPRELSEK